MIKRSGSLNIEQLAEMMRQQGSINLYAREGDTVCYIPYRDLPTGKKEHVKFVKVAGQWVWVDCSQQEG